jgi:c-di-GMP-binding flagellar brake protein YcgR
MWKESAMFQQRKFPRVSKNYHLSYTTIDKEQFAQTPLQSLAVNISGGGVCFEAQEALAEDTLLALEIDTKGFHSPILALARVAWCKQKSSRYDVGAEFWWIGWRDNEAQTALANFIATTATEPQALAQASY